jgi:hypothetical protein
MHLFAGAWSYTDMMPDRWLKASTHNEVHFANANQRDLRGRKRCVSIEVALKFIVR